MCPQTILPQQACSPTAPALWAISRSEIDIHIFAGYTYNQMVKLLKNVFTHHPLRSGKEQPWEEMELFLLDTQVAEQFSKMTSYFTYFKMIKVI